MRIFVSFVVGLVFLVFIVSIVVRPNLVKPIIRKFAMTGEYEPLPIVRSAERHALYSDFDENAPELKHRDLIAIIIGGAFLIGSIKSYYGFANELFTAMSATHDVLIVAYPLRFASTIRDAMLSLNRTFADVALRYKACHLIGFSAGALLAGTFIRKERNEQIARTIDVPQIGLRVDSMCSVCGLLYASFDNEILNALFRFYILSGTVSSKSYHAQALNVPVLVVSSKHDILYNQSARYAQSEPCETKIYNEKLTHTFAQLMNLPEAREVVATIANFVRRSTKST